MKVSPFIFNDFYENTYVCSDETGECIIIDPGCNNDEEREELRSFIKKEGLDPVRLINTHCHIDHVLGNAFISNEYKLPLEAHRGEDIVLRNMESVAQMYGIVYQKSPPISKYIDEGDPVEFGDTRLEVLFTPGHSPASISLFHRESGQLIGGDVLFKGSIGRTDLPGGDFDTLINSIKQKFFPLADEVVVYSGHGPVTTIGEEKRMNPFLVA